MIGSRGSRRFATVPVVPASPAPPRAHEIARPAPPALPARRSDTWMRRLVQFAQTSMIFPRRRHDVPAQRIQPPLDVPIATEDSRDREIAAEERHTDSILESGLRDICRTDQGFDPSRFVGYAAMTFRDAQRAWMARDFGALRERVTPEMHDALHAQCERLRRAHRLNRVAEIEITATITEAWQEGGRDYLTARIGGSMIDYTVDESGDRLVDGSTSSPGAVEQFWTFTRPAGLNFWMLSAIQTA